MQTIWDTSANVIGPVFFFLVWWTLQEAQKRGIKRLYFMARDGQILLEIANLINEWGHFNIECRYLYGSRQAWLTSSIKSIGPSELKWMMSDWWYPLSVNSICHRIGIKPEEFTGILEQYGFFSDRYKDILSSDQKLTFIQCLQSQGFQEWLVGNKKEDFNNLIGYLQQEKLFEDETYGLVDIGWAGNQQLTLNKILRMLKVGPKKGVCGFYLGISESLHKIDGDTLLGFLFNLAASTKRISLRNNHIYEAFTAGLEGRAMKYRCENGKYYPVLGKVNQKLIGWGVGTQREGILKFSRELIRYCQPELIAKENYYPVLEKILHRFINTPSRSEAKAYGQFPMDGEMTESFVQEIAPIVTREQFWHVCFNLKEFRLYWVQAAFIRSQLWLEYYLWKIVIPIIAFSYYLLIKSIKFLKMTRS